MKSSLEQFRVVFVGGLDKDFNCGVKDYTVQLADSLQKESISVMHVSNNVEGQNIVNIDEWRRLKSYLKLIKVLQGRENAIIHIEYPTKAYGKSFAINLVPMILKLHGFRVVFTSHEYSNRSLLGKLRQIPSFLFSDRIIVVEEQFKKDIEKIPFCRNKVSFINIGSNINKSNCPEEVVDSIRKSICNADKKIATYFGFVSKYKCFLELLEAIKLLKDEGKWKSKFLILGELDEHDVYQKRAIDYIESNLKDDVYITGYMPSHRVADYLRASNFAVLPFEFGVSVRNGSFLAAYQEGIDIITSKPKTHFSYTDIVFLDDNSPREIASKMYSVQKRKNNEHKDRIIDYSWDKIALKHIEIYGNM